MEVLWVKILRDNMDGDSRLKQVDNLVEDGWRFWFKIGGGSGLRWLEVLV